MENLVKTTVISNMAELNLSAIDDVITTEQFVTMIFKNSKVNIEPTHEGRSYEYMNYALHKGIIDDYDMTNISNPIERRSAARIVHEMLLTEFGEKDEDEWSTAKKLSDLYTCHTCVIHIAQMYVKGIMLGRDNYVFDVHCPITCAEAAAIVVRMLDKKQRIPQIEDRVFKIKSLSPDEAWELMLDNSRAMLIDVRTSEEYKIGHIFGSICIPLNDISNNPFSVCENKDTPIIFYCQMGYKSSVAAQILIDVGYSRIYIIPGIAQYQYDLTQY
jgi:rhodanese-related sulfurtransferase